MEVHNGATPILQQVGPYYYDEYKEKINVIDNDAEDSLQYDAFDTYRFNKTLSGSLSDEDYVTIIHPLLVRNATIADTIKIMRGIKNYKDLGRVLEVNGKKDIGLWGTEECNRFKGTDGWIIPPLLKPEEGIKCYTTHLCRNIALDYVRDDVLRGINVRRYEGNLGDQQNNSADKCYCPEPRPCLKKGTFELSKCIGAPIIASLPHFLEADESLLTQVKGLNPVHEDHIMNVNIDPALDLEGPLFTKISNIFILLKMAHIMRWLFLVASIGVFGYGTYTHFKSSKKVKITPVHQRTTNDDNPVKRNTNELMNQLRNEGKNGYTNNIMTGHEFDRYG
ncbi:unnamed protein product [Diabrotica balteata]|uniref:Sensory neuron membrane protein 1 n=1 Tax=Diabrotica balteata TaxID=107213 RepID=A0A9N9T0I2_DIABA|nr:unnamed protein product [Diabrotica balteata]